MPSTPTKTPLQAAARALWESGMALETAAGDTTNPNFKAALEATTKAWGQLQDLAKGATSSSIADFFSAIGTGIIDAQKKLDQASEQYIRGALSPNPTGSAPRSPGAPPGGPPAMGAMFRIPRVTAELKCSLETDHEKKFNVILYSERTDVRDFHQQTVQLEVVSVPVSPDYLNYLLANPTAGSGDAGKAPVTHSIPGSDGQASESEKTAETPEPIIFADSEQPSSQSPLARDDGTETRAPTDWRLAEWLQCYLVEEAEREQVRGLIEKLDAKQPGRRRSVVRERLLPAWSQAVVLTDGGNARFVLLASKASPAQLLIWQVVLRPASLQLLGKVPTRSLRGPDYGRLHRLIARLGEAQAAAERPLRDANR